MTHHQLKDKAKIIFPDFCDFIDCNHAISNSYWDGRLKTGKLLEIGTLFAISKALKNIGCTISIPDYYSENPECYYLRNEIPLQHGAAAGHDVAILSTVSLKNRFISALTPKIIFEYSNKKFSVFREGIPIHKVRALLSNKDPYDVRPDLTVVEGEFRTTLLNESVIRSEVIRNGQVNYYDFEIRNTAIIPMINFAEENFDELNVTSIIECSMGKTVEYIDRQLDLYSKIFHIQNKIATKIFIHAHHVHSKYPTLIVERDHILESLSSDLFLEKFAFLLEPK